MPMTRFETARRIGCLAAALCVAIHGPAFAQVVPPEVLVRVATAPTPPVTDPTIVRQRRVEIASLATLAGNARLRLDLFPDLSLVAVREGMQGANAALSWTGRLEGYPNSSVVLAQARGVFAGHVHAPFGFFRIDRSPTGGYLVQQVDDAAVSGRDDSLPATDTVPAGDPAPPARDGVRIRPQAVDGTIIDVMVVYTPSAVTNIGGEAAALTTTDLLVVETNFAFRNSGVDAQLRLVHSGTVEYEEAGESAADLQRLRATADGFLDEIHALRDAVGADLVVLVVEQMEEEWCGRGYVNNPVSLGQSGFSIVKRRCTNDGQTFAHEVGHNLGAKHDWYVDDTAGAFPHSHGVVSLPGRFRDLMAYPNLCSKFNLRCQRLLAFSNPGLSHMGEPLGVPAGTDVSCKVGDMEHVGCDADVADTFIQMAPVVARFRSYKQRATGPLRPVLRSGDEILSASGRFALTYRGDGNLVLTDTELRTTLWSTGTAGTVPGQVVLQEDGNMVVYDGGGRFRWSSGTEGNPLAYLQLDDDGSLAIYSADGRRLWDRQQAR